MEYVNKPCFSCLGSTPNDITPDGIEFVCKEGEYAGKFIHVENRCKNIIESTWCFALFNQLLMFDHLLLDVLFIFSLKAECVGGLTLT